MNYRIHIEIEIDEDGEDMNRAFLGAISQLAAEWVRHGAPTGIVAKALQMVADQLQRARKIHL
jgi:hypothetical protein